MIGFRHILMLIAAMAALSPCFAQNLVPNPSFEQFNNCPSSLGGVNYAPGYTNFPTVQSWVSPTQSGSPDYFNACASPISYVSIPQNAFGTQSPRNGDAYIGIIAWEGSNQGGNIKTEFAEYLQCKLTQPLTAGNQYCITYFVNSAVANIPNNYVGIDEFGVSFSSSQYNITPGYTIKTSYDVVNTSGNFLSDTSNWMKVSGVYTASGGEEWLTIGWFDNNTIPAFNPVFPLTPNPADKYRAYLFLDDVSVIKLDKRDTIYHVVDTTYCNPAHLPLELTSSIDLADYQWNNGKNEQAININQSGTYWCVAEGACRVYIDSYKIKYEPAPQLDLGKELINCENQPVTISANYPNSTYSWNTGETTEKITAIKSGLYILTIQNECGEQTDSVHVYIQPPSPAPAPVDTMVCQFVQNPVINVGAQNVLWYSHASGRYGIPVQPPVITREPSSYSFFITQTIGKCESEKVEVKVDVNYTPHEVLGDQVTMCDNNLEIIGEDIKEVEFTWNTGSNSCCILPDRDGTYKLAMTNVCGTYIDTLRVYYSDCTDCIAFPNAFTPANHSQNLVFKPLVKCPVDEFHMEIYNRWGNLVYESDDVNDGWNGRVNYQWGDAGVYIYIVEYRAKDKPAPKRISGNVTLFR